jgi:pyruvate,water dikinase
MIGAQNISTNFLIPEGEQFMNDYVIGLNQLNMNDVDRVGGKNASLGEMISQLSGMGVSVPGGFATTAFAFIDFLEKNKLKDKIDSKLSQLDTDDVQALAKTGAEIRDLVVAAPFPAELEDAIRKAYTTMSAESGSTLSVAVRSSATAEDLPDASFAGQQETFLNVQGIENVLTAVKHVFASLYNDRAISYRVHHGFEHSEVALSAGIQKMVRSDLGASGVMFTMDTESGFDKVVFITSSWGLGETVVQGAVNPDEFYVYKPALEAGKQAVLRKNAGTKLIKMVYSAATGHGKSVETVETSEEERTGFSLTNEEIESLARQAMTIEKHYKRPMDIEWGKDGGDGKLYILQARPETVRSRDNTQMLERYHLETRGEILTTGRSIGQKIGAGKVRVVNELSEMNKVMAGDVLVTDMTDPDWEPIMKRASAIVTNRGGRTCHAAIIARELGIPAVVGCGDATRKITDGIDVTVSCAEGDTGYIYEGIQKFEKRDISLSSMPDLPFKIMMNVGNPERAFDFQKLPNAGVGLARLEFIINRMIGVHPNALLNFTTLSADLQATIEKMIAGYADPVSYYIDKLTEGVATIAAAFAPQPVIVRLSDFKSNEYANLLGGNLYEPHEENPMLGFRGASRYISPSFQKCFELECKALKKAREEIGLTNIWIMAPFVRTVDEAKSVLQLLEENGLKRGENGLKVIMMCEIPSNALLADQFLEHFDGFSIGSNDLTQLTLGLDRDSGLIAHLFDERDPAVKALLSMAIQACRKAGKYIGICGQGPSDHPDLARWLMEQGIESVSLNPDSVVETWLYLANSDAS